MMSFDMRLGQLILMIEINEWGGGQGQDLDRVKGVFNLQ